MTMLQGPPGLAPSASLPTLVGAFYFMTCSHVWNSLAILASVPGASASPNY